MDRRGMFSPGHGSPIQREDGTVVQDQRRMTFFDIVDKFFPWAIAGLLVWLCLGQMTLQAQMGTLLERTSNQGRALDSEREDRRAGDSFIQSEVDSIRAQQSQVDHRSR